MPIVALNQILLLRPRYPDQGRPDTEKASAKEFAPAAEEFIDRIMQMTDNAGTTDEHLALKYLAVRYPAITRVPPTRSGATPR